MMKVTLQITENRVKIKSLLTGMFEVKEGMRQSEPFSSMLFNIILEKKYTRSFYEQIKVDILKKIHQYHFPTIH